VHQLALLSEAVEDLVLVSKVNEGEPIESQVACVDEPLVAGMQLLVEGHQVLSVVAVQYGHAVELLDSNYIPSYMYSSESLRAIETLMLGLSSLRL